VVTAHAYWQTLLQERSCNINGPRELIGLHTDKREQRLITPSSQPAYEALRIQWMIILIQCVDDYFNIVAQNPAVATVECDSMHARLFDGMALRSHCTGYPSSS